MADSFYIGISLLGCISLLSNRTNRWSILWTILCVITAAVAWSQKLTVAPIAQLSPAIVVMFALPGFLLLELACPALAHKLDSLERGPLLFGLSMGIWTLIALAAYRVQMSSDLVIGGVLVGDAIGLLAVFGFRLRHRDLKRFPEKNNSFEYVKLSYFICLIVVLLIVSGLVGFTAQFQGHEFDSCTHIAGYHKIAESAKILGGNPLLGPQYSYIPPHTASPWYLVFGLSARLAHTNVTWLYAYLAALLSILFFLSIYSLIKVLTKNYWIATIGTLLVIGPWIAKMALLWGPSTGTFYLQFLPFPGTCTHLILCPLWFAYCFRYVRFQTSENWIIVALLATAVMGVHPELGIPYSICIVFLVSIIFLTTRRDKVKTFFLVITILISGAIIAYVIVNPVGKEHLKDGWVTFDPEDVLRQFLAGAWIISPNLYAIHPKFLMTLDTFKNIIGCIVMSLFIIYQPKLSIKKRSQTWYPAFSITISRDVNQLYFAATIVAVLMGQYLILYNPIMVPIIIKLFGSAVPIRLFARPYEILSEAYFYGSISCILFILINSIMMCDYRRNLKYILLAAILIVGFGFPLGRQSVRSVFAGMFDYSGKPVSILDLKNNTPYKELSLLDPGVVAIGMEHSEYLVMSSHHYVVASTRMTKKRMLDNERILNFRIPPDAMRSLLDEYNVRYVAVSLNDNMISNGGFSLGTSDWSAGYGLKISSGPGGKNGNVLQITAEQYGSQIVWQNLIFEPGKYYRISAFVKSGTSGNEPFKIQIFQKNAAGQGEFSIEGISTESWMEYSGIFEAKDRNLCVLLRKDSATKGTMLFSDVTCREVIPLVKGNLRKYIAAPSAVQRFRNHPNIFKELITCDQHAIFEVKNEQRQSE